MIPSFSAYFTVAQFSRRRLSLWLGLLLIVGSWQAHSQTRGDALFVEAMSHIANQQWQKAEALLEFQLKQNPGWHRARIELAQVYRHQNKFSQALAQLDNVLATGSLPPPVTANLQALKKDIAAQQNIHSAKQDALAAQQGALAAPQNTPTALERRVLADDELDSHHVNSYLELAFGYDDNVRFSSGDYFLNDDPYLDGFFFIDQNGSVLYLAPDGFIYDAEGNRLFENDGAFDLGDPDRGNTFIETHFAISHEFRSTAQRHNNGRKQRHHHGKRPLFTWENQLLVQNSQNAEFREFNKLQIRFSSELSWQLSDSYVFAINAHSRLLKRDGDVQVRSHGISPSFTYYSEFGAWEFGFEWLDREYEEAEFIQGDFISVFSGFSSTTNIYSLKWSKLFFDNRLLLLSKLETMKSDTSDNFDFTGLRGTLAAVYSINDRLKWSFSVVDLSLDYDPPFAFEIDLKDDSSTYKTKLSYDLSRAWVAFLSAERGRRASDIYGGISSDKALSKIGVRFKF